MGKKTEPFSNYPQWTEARFWSFIRSALRGAWSRYPVKYQVLNEAYVLTKVNAKTGREAKHYKCADCLDLFPAKEVQIDHIEDCGTLKTYADLPMFVKRLFCSKEELQVLCKKCHLRKTHGHSN